MQRRAGCLVLLRSGDGFGLLILDATVLIKISYGEEKCPGCAWTDAPCAYAYRDISHLHSIIGVRIQLNSQCDVCPVDSEQVQVQRGHDMHGLDFLCPARSIFQMPPMPVLCVWSELRAKHLENLDLPSSPFSLKLVILSILIHGFPSVRALRWLPLPSFNPAFVIAALVVVFILNSHQPFLDVSVNRCNPI
jgi:hypothetical protein